ncbi:MAG TPA: hypothetical protein VMT46_05525 [Anaerolineaceae bacterium]|nr:hypothetical protein [Anaerolineaceae bacterium]
MQTCTRCSTQSPDTALVCNNCQADLSIYSATAVALKRYQVNPRVRLVKIAVCSDSCPVCYEMRGAYEKDAVPGLPVEGCSHPHGCRCFYEPELDELYP